MNTHIQNTAETKSSLRGGADWKFALLGALSTSAAKRVLTAADFHVFAKSIRPGVSLSTSRTVADMLVSAGALRRISNGVFLNRRAIPSAELTEAAQYIRAGAVISLHSVLGEIGFLNNPSEIVTAVLPTSATKRPRLGEVKTSSNDVFRFFGVAEKFFPSSKEEMFEYLQPGRPCPTFRPEAALLHWLHLAGMQRSTLTAPPYDVDFEVLDSELLYKLAREWQLEISLNEWYERAKKVNFGEESEQKVSPSDSQRKARTTAADARARMMARLAAHKGS